MYGVCTADTAEDSLIGEEEMAEGEDGSQGERGKYGMDTVRGAGKSM